MTASPCQTQSLVPPATALPRLLAPGAGPDLAAHRSRYDPPRLPRRRQDVVDAVQAAGLRGRGGAGFPTARKLAAVAGRRRRAVVLVNACEGEPASAKDRALLALAPHLVLDGAVLAAHAVGASEVILCAHRGGEQADRLDRAVAQRRGDPVRLTVVRVPRRYVASEESALVHFVNDGDARPLATPPRPFERGVHRRPTLVDNAETLAHLAQIMAFGPDWFRSVGTPTDPGSSLVTLGGAVARPGVYEMALGAPVHAMINLAGGAVKPVQAVLVGGYFGTWLPWPAGADLPLGHDPAGTTGVSLGAGVLAALPAAACGLAETARVLTYLARESARQCGPCMFGLPAIAGDLVSIVYGRADRAVRHRLAERLAVINGRGACRHPDGAVRLADSALRAFRTDLDAHLAGRPCRGVRHAPVLPIPGRQDGGWR